MNPRKLIGLLLLCAGAPTISQGHHNNRALYDPEIIVEIEGDRHGSLVPESPLTRIP